ncbi:hypothetical protein T02_3780 [Trichinella nativa]|uniref:Uncharacterized protein n=1 Tax=Trichinella nativa TaxID=6335 RepID=A0A0V1L5J3_9BILA|nr:hypothetical protein T02_3780 [Trichinella nativa]
MRHVVHILHLCPYKWSVDDRNWESAVNVREPDRGFAVVRRLPSVCLLFGAMFIDFLSYYPWLTIIRCNMVKVGLSNIFDFHAFQYEQKDTVHSDCERVNPQFARYILLL